MCDLGQDRRARFRPQDRRGHARRRAAHPEVIRAYLGRRPMTAMLLGSRSLTAALWRHRGAAWLDLERGRGRHHRDPGRQRRRQNHDATGHLRHGGADAARYSLCRQAHRGRLPRHRAARHRPCAARARHFPAPVGRGKPRVSARIAPRPRRSAADFDRVYRTFPRLKERRRQQAGTSVGGEQQMLADGARHDAAAEIDAARRAVVRPRTADRARSFSASCGGINQR